jgi:hypothetical protein
VNAYGHVITRVRADLVDGYGGQLVRDWAHAKRVEAAGNVQAVDVRENTTNRQVVTTDRRVNTALELTETDRLEWDGKTYEITGVEEFYQSGRLDHYEATLQLSSEAAA